MNTHGLRIDFGKHSGELWTRVPVSYLTWILNEITDKPEVTTIAEAELKRRGSTYPKVEISGHAIDRASLGCRKIWHKDRGEREGLHAWLIRIAGEAIQEHGVQNGKYKHKGMKLVLNHGKHYPTLVTIMRDEKRVWPDGKLKKRAIKEQQDYGKKPI